MISMWSVCIFLLHTFIDMIFNLTYQKAGCMLVDVMVSLVWSLWLEPFFKTLQWCVCVCKIMIRHLAGRLVLNPGCECGFCIGVRRVVIVAFMVTSFSQTEMQKRELTLASKGSKGQFKLERNGKVENKRAKLKLEKLVQVHF